MTCATYANNDNATSLNINDDITSVQNAGPHTKQYRDIKEVLDRYERNINAATSCEDLGEAEDSFYSSLLIMQFDDAYDYEESDLMTDEESQEIDEQSKRIDALLAQKTKQLGCQNEEEAIPEKTAISTEEWNEIIAEYEVLLSKLEQLRKQNLDFEQNANKFLEIVQDHMGLLDRLDNADTTNLTEYQERRLTEIDERIGIITKEMGLVSDDDE